MKRRKAAKLKDFSKKKKKLGKGKKLPDNATITSFKSRSIQMPMQLEESTQHGPTTYRNLSLQELLRHISHHKPSVRKDGLSGIRELLQSTGATELIPSIGDVINKSSPLFIDSDSNVRHSLYLLLKQVFQSIDEKFLKPFFPLLLASLKCGLTHINTSIQENSLKITNVIISHSPGLIKPSINDLIPLYLPLVAMKTHPSSISSKKSDFISLYVAKQPVLDQLLKFMLLLKGEDATPTYNAPIISVSDDKVWPNGDRTTPPTDLTSFYANTPFLLMINPRLFPTVKYRLSSNVTQSSTIRVNRGFESHLIKVLFELWIEIVSNSLMESTTGSSSSCDLSSVMATILRLLCLIIDSSHTESISEDKLMAHFGSHFVPYFPIFARTDPNQRQPPHVLMTNLYFIHLILTVTTKLQPRPLNQSRPSLPVQPVISFLSSHLPRAPSTLSSTELVECVSIVIDIIQGLLSPAHTLLPSLATPLFTSCHSLFTSCHPHSTAKLKFLSFIDKIGHRVLVLDNGPPPDLFMDHFLYPSLCGLPRLLAASDPSLEHVKLIIRGLKTALTCQVAVVIKSFNDNQAAIDGILPSLPLPLQQELAHLKSHIRISEHNE